MMGHEARVRPALDVTSLMGHCPIGSNLGGQSHAHVIGSADSPGRSSRRWGHRWRGWRR